MALSFANDNTNQDTNSGIVRQLINRIEELSQAVLPSDSISRESMSYSILGVSKQHNGIMHNEKWCNGQKIFMTGEDNNTSFIANQFFFVNRERGIRYKTTNLCEYRF